MTLFASCPWPATKLLPPITKRLHPGPRRSESSGLICAATASQLAGLFGRGTRTAVSQLFLTQASASLRFLVLKTVMLSPKTNCMEELVTWCFEPSQPLGIISGLKETFIKRYKVERTNKAEIRLEEQSKKAENCRENSWKEIQLKGP